MNSKDVRIRPLYCRFKQLYIWAQDKNHGQFIALIEIETDDGIVGIGETAPKMMNIHPVLSFFETIKPILIGETVFDLSSLMKKIFTRNFDVHTVSHSHTRVANQV